MADGHMKVEIFKDGEEWKAVLKGPLDEFAMFPPASGTSALRVDLLGVSHVNSLGVRAWCEWLRLQKARTKVTMCNCPVFMVRQFSSVRGTLTSNSIIESFFVPFFSPESDERKEHLFR